MPRAQNIRGPRMCTGCPTVFTPQPRGKIPERCPTCRTQPARGPQKCQDCPAIFTPGPIGAIALRCPACREKTKRVWKEQTYRRSASAVPLDNTRPCGRHECTNTVSRNGKVYPRFCSDDCKPRCSVDDCSGVSRKRGFCVGHYQMWRRFGEIRPWAFQWSDKGGACLACDAELDEESEHRDFCNGACRAYYRTHGADAPKVIHCMHCLIEIPVGKVEGRHRRRRLDVKVCRRCRQDMCKYGISAEQLAARDGAICQLCLGVVDMTLRAPDPGCPSVDHRHPVARGGTNDPGNLQLAHLNCNVRKKDKIVEELVLAA